MAQQAPTQNAIGIFDSHSDVGETPKKGSATFDSASGEYRVTGGGANIWAAADAFQFVWKRVSSDLSLSADVHFVGAGAVEHRKAVLMVRQNLDTNSPYADIALHGDGLTALQYRPAASAQTLELRLAENAPVRLRIERRGNQFTVFAGQPGGTLAGVGLLTVAMSDPVYIGLGVCSHDANVLETATFSNVTIGKPEPATLPQNASNVRSRIMVHDLDAKTSRVVFTDDKLWEAPNWSPDGKYLLANSGGQIYRLALNGGSEAQPQKIGLDPAYECNNDHALSPDGKWLAFSANHGGAHGSRVFLATADGANPKLMTPQEPSYFHGWSPDGKWLAYVGERNHSFNIFRVSASGGPEERLTSHLGYDDGPDYAPDGKWIYINSNRSGSWGIWRFPPDGAGPNDERAERLVVDELENWFPHPSPDGNGIVWLSFPHGTPNHDAKINVVLRMMEIRRDTVKNHPEIEVLPQFFGGQGTINVNSWSPDSKHFAYVSYELLSR